MPPSREEGNPTPAWLEKGLRHAPVLVSPLGRVNCIPDQDTEKTSQVGTRLPEQ